MQVGWLMEGGEAGRFLGRIEGIGWLLRKNRIENGSRADPSGSNPHSYGDSFSVSGAIWASQKFKPPPATRRVGLVLSDAAPGCFPSSLQSGEADSVPAWQKKPTTSLRCPASSP